MDAMEPSLVGLTFQAGRQSCGSCPVIINVAIVREPHRRFRRTRPYHARCSTPLDQATFSNRKPFKYSVSGIIGMMGWSGDCEKIAVCRNRLRVSYAAERITSRKVVAST